MRHVFVDGDEYTLKPSLRRRVSRRPLAKYSQVRVAARLAVVADEVVAETFVNAPVEQNAHLVGGEQGCLRFFQCQQRGFTADGGEVYESFETVARLEIVE